MKKLVAALIALAVLLAVAWSYRIPIYLAFSQPQMLREPTFETVRPEVPPLSGTLKVLVFSKTNGYRHASIPDAVQMLRSIAENNDWGFFHTENSAVFNTEDLADFDVVALASATGPLFDSEQEEAFRAFVTGGGGIVGIHAAGDSSHVWGWYNAELICARFIDHPMAQHIQEATLVIEDPDHPATRHLGAQWIRSDEWYNFDKSPRERVNVLLSIDETTYDPEQSPMGADHPMVWWRQVGEGRVLYSALGHTAESYAESEHQTLIAEAIRWAGSVAAPSH